MTRRNDHPLPAYIGKYKVRARLGSGGMADVFLATFEGPAGFKKPVAIKRMKPSLAKTEEFVELFLTEARTAAMLAHPNVCQVHELGTSNKEKEGYFIVMEYLTGIPLTKILRKQMSDNQSFPMGMILGLSAQACEGMHYAHTFKDPYGESYNIIHRDLSPPNIFLTTNGTAKILDFGISKSTQSVIKTATGQIRGKFTYMSPEQLKGIELDPRSDVFSLAIIVFELLTGTRLFKRPTRIETFQAVSITEIPRADTINPQIPKQVADVIEVGLARDRTHRFASARAFGAALGETARHCGGAWTSPAIAEFGETFFEEELAAHSEWLNAAQTGGLSEEDEVTSFHNKGETVSEEESHEKIIPKTKLHKRPTNEK